MLSLEKCLSHWTKKRDEKNWKLYHSPTMNPMEAKKATMPTMVEKWQAEDSMFMTQTSCWVSWMKNHPEDETHPKTMMAKNYRKKNPKSHDSISKCSKKSSYQSANPHANDGSAQKSQGVLGTSGLCPTKGTSAITPRVHGTEVSVPLLDQPRQLNTNGLVQLQRKAAEDRFTRLFYIVVKAVVAVALKAGLNVFSTHTSSESLPPLVVCWHWSKLSCCRKQPMLEAFAFWQCWDRAWVLRAILIIWPFSNPNWCSDLS